MDRKEKITRFKIKGQHFKPLVVFTKISKPILCTKTSLDYESLNIKFDDIECLKKVVGGYSFFYFYYLL